MSYNKFADANWIKTNIYPLLKADTILNSINFWKEILDDPINRHLHEKAKIKLAEKREEYTQVFIDMKNKGVTYR